MLTRLTQNFYLFQDGAYHVACHKGEAISNSETKNLTGLAPSDSLLLCLIRRSLFLFRLPFPYLPLSFTHPSLVIPVKTGIQSAISGSPIRSASLSVEDDKGVCHSRENGNPVFLSGSRIKCGMTGGTGSCIKCGMTPYRK